MANSYHDIAAAMADLKKQGMMGFIVERRFNPGGLLKAAVDISDLFMDDGVILSLRPRGKLEAIIHGNDEGSLLDFPMVCLVSGVTASGSEVIPRRDAPMKDKDPNPEFKDLQLEQVVEYLTSQHKTTANIPMMLGK